MLVVIVDDPELGIDPENLKSIGTKVPDRCPHLRGDRPGEHSCAVHNYPWYKDTPCASHGQIEKSPDTECRTGRYILDKENAKNKKTKRKTDQNAQSTVARHELDH